MLFQVGWLRMSGCKAPGSGSLGAISWFLNTFPIGKGLDVSLRPEFTSAILRHAADNGSTQRSVRLMYDGPVFRYADPEDEDGDKTRQFTQLGAELIGPPAPSADGEIIAMALEGLQALGVGNARVVVGHVGEDDPNYQGRYTGSRFDRDQAYHQGTVWPWLMGPYAEAVLRLGKFSDASKAEARQAIEPLLEELMGRGMGQISEIYEGDPPHRPVGCIAQAWSVAELLRVMRLIETH